MGDFAKATTLGFRNVIMPRSAFASRIVLIVSVQMDTARKALRRNFYRALGGTGRLKTSREDSR